MIFPSNRVRIPVAPQPVDFRKGHDGLAALLRSVLRKDPFTGTVFVFRAKRLDRLKTAAAKDLDLSVLPPEYRAAFEAQAAGVAELGAYRLLD